MLFQARQRYISEASFIACLIEHIFHLYVDAGAAAIDPEDVDYRVLN
jgi:hypothetical protein